MFNTAIAMLCQELLERKAKMKLGGYEVTQFNSETATVNGVTVTRGEVDKLAWEMSLAPPPFKITAELSRPESTQFKKFVNFEITAGHSGWVSTGEGDGYNAKKVTFCLRTPYAIQLHKFLDEEILKRQ